MPRILSRNALRNIGRWRAGLALAAALGLPSVATADVVTDWNAIAETVATRFGGPQPQSRVLAMAQIAVHDALNAIEPRYARYTGAGQSYPGASPDAAVAAAARKTLLDLLAPLPPSAQDKRDRPDRGRLPRSRRSPAVRRRDPGRYRCRRVGGRRDPRASRERRIRQPASCLTHCRPDPVFTNPRRPRNFPP